MSSFFDSEFSQLGLGTLGAGSAPSGPLSFEDRAQPVEQAVQSGAFDPQGLNFSTFVGVPGTDTAIPQANPTGPNVSASSSSSDLPAIGGSASSPSAAAASSALSPASPIGTTGSISGATANNWFVRAVIVILGFIFVAVGLSQFGVVQRINPMK